MDNQPVSFPGWKGVLAQTSLSQGAKASYAREIITFLHHCKVSRAAATVELAKQYLSVREKLSTGPAREALRWFYREGSRQQASAAASGAMVDPGETAPMPVRRSALRPMEPRPAAQDLGTSEWEKALIKTMRVRGLLWRTEETYRSWGRRFATFIAPKTPYAAGADQDDHQSAVAGA